MRSVLAQTITLQLSEITDEVIAYRYFFLLKQKYHSFSVSVLRLPVKIRSRYIVFHLRVEQVLVLPDDGSHRA